MNTPPPWMRSSLLWAHLHHRDPLSGRHHQAGNAALKLQESAKVTTLPRAANLGLLWPRAHLPSGGLERASPGDTVRFPGDAPQPAPLSEAFLPGTQQGSPRAPGASRRPCWCAGAGTTRPPSGCEAQAGRGHVQRRAPHSLCSQSAWQDTPLPPRFQNVT